MDIPVVREWLINHPTDSQLKKKYQEEIKEANMISRAEFLQYRMEITS